MVTDGKADTDPDLSSHFVTVAFTRAQLRMLVHAAGLGASAMTDSEEKSRLRRLLRDLQKAVDNAAP